MSEFTIRSARPAELERVGGLTVRAYRASGLLDFDYDYSRELADTTRRAELAELLVAVDADGTLLGTVTIAQPGTEFAEVAGPGDLEFRMLATDPQARGRGVGEALTRAVVDRARELGRTRVVLCSRDVMTTAHRLYTRLGFTRIPEHDWVPVPGVVLWAFAMAV